MHYLFIYSIYLKDRERVRERQRDVYASSPVNSFNSQDWVMQKPRTRNCMWISHTGGRSPTYYWGHCRLFSAVCIGRNPESRAEHKPTPAILLGNGHTPCSTSTTASHTHSRANTLLPLPCKQYC